MRQTYWFFYSFTRPLVPVLHINLASFGLSSRQAKNVIFAWAALFLRREGAINSIFNFVSCNDLTYQSGSSLTTHIAKLKRLMSSCFVTKLT